VNQDYFSRTLTRIDERDNLTKEQLFGFMAMLMNPQQDTVTFLLGEVQNEIFSQQPIEEIELDSYILARRRLFRRIRRDYSIVKKSTWNDKCSP
jgi:hypothetical protein